MAIKKKVNPLVDKKVSLKLIKEKGNRFLEQLHNDHDGKYRFSNCVERVVLDIGKWKHDFNEILTLEEQAFFENIFNYEAGWLSPYNQKSDFWITFSISLTKNDLVLNLNKPLDYIKYKVLLSQPFIRKNDEDTHPARRYYFVEEGQEAIKSANIAEIKSKAFKLFDKVKDNKSEMIDILKTLGRMVTNTTDSQTLQGWLGDIIDTVNKKTKPNIYTFIEAMEDPFRIEKLFIINGIGEGDIIHYGDDYLRADTKKVIAVNDQEMYKFIKDPINQDWVQMVRVHIKQNK